MTYENASKWCEENVPMKMFKDYQSWYDQCYDELQTPKLFESKRFNDMLEDIWAKGHKGEEPRPPLPTFKTKFARSRYVAEQLIEIKPTFTTKEFYEVNPLRPRPSLRRDLQQLINKGVLIRESKGVYKSA